MSMHQRMIPRSVPSTSAAVPLPIGAGARVDSEDNGPYLFSPKAISLKPAPRAWERRLATPFAPRTESHKIWKRCLLGQFGRHVGGALPGLSNDSWRRSVKRLRVLREGDPRGQAQEAGGGYVGTSFVGLEDMERAKERKKVNEELYEALRGLRDADKMINNKVERKINGEDAGRGMVVDNRRQDGDAAIASGISTTRKIKASYDGTAVFSALRGEEPQRLCQEGQQSKVQESREATRNTHNTAIMADSEDTEYLHAFLTRAKAKKAARAIPDLPSNGSLEPGPESPRASQSRSPKDSSAFSEETSSLQKRDEVQACCGQEMQTVRAMTVDGEAPSPLRKSTRRRRTPHQQTVQPPTPNTIPFRRANGSELIVLPKTEAQQTATATRSNTRKNRGDGVQPKTRLQALFSQCEPSPAAVTRKKMAVTVKGDYCKRVSWDEALTYFALTPSASGEDGTGQLQRGEAAPASAPASAPSERTPTKRNRRKGTSRSTPAPQKKMAEAGCGSAPSTPRTRSRDRTK